MLLSPEIQKKAQDELDPVVGRDRLPTVDDRPSLPFVDAVCKEVLRWRPPTPACKLIGYSDNVWALGSVSHR